MILTGPQISAAIALAKMTREGLAKEAGIGRNTLNNIVNGTASYREDTIRKIRGILEARGIEFTDNQGVRFKPTDVTIYDGQDAFEAFYDYMYEHLKKNGGDVCLSIYDENLLVKFRKDPEIHRNRMRGLVKRGDVTFRTLATKSEFATNGYMRLKWLPNQQPVSTGFYAFGECLALMSFVNPLSPYVIVITSGPMTQAYREGFNIAWENAEEPPVGGVK